MNEKGPVEPVFEKEQQEKSESLKGEFFIKLFTSPEFKNKLLSVVDITHKTGREAGINVYKEFDQPEPWISPVKEGSNDEIKDDWMHDQDPELSDEYTLGEDYYQVLGIHFHPEATGAICPSIPFENENGDLGTFGHNHKFPHILGIGQVDEKKNISILLLKRIGKTPFSNFYLEEMGEAVKEMTDQNEIIKTLKEFGIQTELITFQKNAGLSAIDIEKIKSFELQHTKENFEGEY